MQARYALIPAAFLLLGGCAADQIRAPASTVGNEIAKFHAALVDFSEDLKVLQHSEEVSIEGTVARRDVYAVAAQQMQVEWTVAGAKSDREVFKALQDQGRAEAARIAAQSAGTPKAAAPALPLDRLGEVATKVTALSKPSGVKDDLETLLNYGIAVNKQLKALEDSAKQN